MANENAATFNCYDVNFTCKFLIVMKIQITRAYM